jgi:hypothetical protein
MSLRSDEVDLPAVSLWFESLMSPAYASGHKRHQIRKIQCRC